MKSSNAGEAVRQSAENLKDGVKDNLYAAKEVLKEKGSNAAESIKKPIVGAVRKAPRPGLFGFVLAIGGAVGAYYYWNYMRKPNVDNYIKPSTETRRDAQNLLNASNKLAGDLKK